MTSEASSAPSRRTVAKGTAWLVPAVALSSAAPNASASTPAPMHVDNPEYHAVDEGRLFRGKVDYRNVDYWLDKNNKLFAFDTNNLVVSQDHSSDWMVLRNEAHYTGLTPWTNYQFTVKLQAGMAGGCPDRHAPASIRIQTSPYSVGPWSEELYVASEPAAATIPDAKAPRHDLEPYAGPFHCQDASLWKRSLFKTDYDHAPTFTIRGNSGKFGQVHFIFDYWAETRPTDEAPQGGINRYVRNTRFLVGWPLNPTKLP